MANNRMMIRCRSCGKTIIIAKHLLSPWHIVPQLEDKLAKFFEEHYYCEINPNVYPNSFELVSEMGEGFPNEEDEILTHYYDIYNDHYADEIANQAEEKKYEIVHSHVLRTMYMNDNKEENNEN